MQHKIAMTIIALSLGASCFILMPPPASWAQGLGRAAPAPQGGGGGAVAPHGGGGGGAVAPQHGGTMRAVAPRATRTVTPRAARTVTPGTTRTLAQPKATSRIVRQPKATRKFVAPTATGRKVVSPGVAPRVFTPHGTRTVTASRLRGIPARGAGRTVIHGQNYAAWRSGHRVRHGSGWRTFVGLGVLGAIAIDSNEYYPYAYISAPEDYCQGLKMAAN